MKLKNEIREVGPRICWKVRYSQFGSASSRNPGRPTQNEMEKNRKSKKLGSSFLSKKHVKL